MLAYGGIIIGFIFGFLLQRGQVLKNDNQIAAMQLKSFNIFRFMMSAMITASIGWTILAIATGVEIPHETFGIFSVVVGGSIFGLGWGLLGYCPGTTLGALGEGQIDALFGFVGLIAGSIFYALIYPTTSKLMEQTVIGSPSFLGFLPQAVSTIIFIVCVLGFFKLLKKINL